MRAISIIVLHHHLLCTGSTTFHLFVLFFFFLLPHITFSFYSLYFSAWTKSKKMGHLFDTLFSWFPVFYYLSVCHLSRVSLLMICDIRHPLTVASSVSILDVLTFITPYTFTSNQHKLHSFVNGRRRSTFTEPIAFQQRTIILRLGKGVVFFLR